MNRLSRSGLVSNDLDSSNDIFGETPEASPQVRGFRQVLSIIFSLYSEQEGLMRYILSVQ